ncbi:MAG TPA: signal peptide peptidase SppA [Burkholderiaceae bacterium]
MSLSSPFRLLGRGIAFLWRLLDASRRAILNVLFLLLIIWLIFALSGRGKTLQDKTALVLDIKGRVVEQHTGTVRDMVLAGAQGSARKETQLRDVLSALEAAAKDPQIGSVVLMLDDMNSAGLPMLREMAAAVGRFRASGKPVYAWGSSFDQRQYYLASQADQVWMHPMGMVLIEGYGKTRNYYRDALDKLGVTVNVLRVGTYKSFGETFVANGPSPAAQEADLFLYKSMWDTYTGDVEKARKLPAGHIAKTIDQLPELLKAAGGDIAKLTLQARMVDQLKTRDELRDFLIAKGARDPDTKSFRAIGLRDYLTRVTPKLLGDAVGVVVASGEITDGTAPAGSIGGLSTAAMVRKAREDDRIKAVVLRVDSPGGSVFGSELIRRELELTRKAGKPVVISMGNVAASGGYWISMASDEIVADQATITGSIGVFAILPTADKVIDKLGIHTGGVSTTWLGDVTNPLRPLDPRFADLIQTGIGHIYADFTTKAAQARKTTPAAIDAVAQGRVWTGIQAKERGLIDTVGTYRDALQSAARRAKLGEDFRVVYLERTSSKVDSLFELFGAQVNQALAQHVGMALVPTGLPPAPARQIAQDLGWLSELTESKKLYAPLTHCLCVAP